MSDIQLPCLTLYDVKMATVWIILAQVVCLQLIAATITNIASGEEARMSSNFGGFQARTAVDGNTNAVYPGGIISTAPGQTTAWWKVDLVRDVQEGTVNIYFRTDYKPRRNGVQLYTSTTPFSIYPSGQLCHTFTGRADGTDIPDVVSVNCTGTWRYLMVYTQTENDGQGAVLDFGEVEVLACSIGTYGPDCTKSCRSRQCAVTPTSCYRYTAACPDGRCKTGWTGSYCTEVCLTGTYGQNCMKSCTSRQCAVTPTSCDSVSGTCPSGGCLAGYKGSDCTQGCSSGFYGKNCIKSCGSRKCVTMSTTCDSVTGVCSGGCQPGWRETDCTMMCLQGTYGSACSMSCDNRKCGSSLSSCDFVTGKCVGECQPGWRGRDCTQICPYGNYGVNCQKVCANRHCRSQSSSCDHKTGQCSPDGCQDAWAGIDCTNKCPEGTFGLNCLSCGIRHCEGESGCPVDGTCSNGCQDGWLLSSCTQACPSGTYGPGCVSICGNCAGDGICNHTNGNCPGSCKAGWRGVQCKHTCSNGMFGLNCMESCGHCNGSCDVMDGHCPDGCVDGYCGSHCSNKLESVALKRPCTSLTGTDLVVAGVIGAVISAVLMFILGGGIHLCLVRYGRLKWVKVPDHQKQPTEIGDITSAQVIPQTVPERPNSDSVPSDYAVLDVQTVSNNKDYDVIQNRVYENT